MLVFYRSFLSSATIFSYISQEKRGWLRNVACPTFLGKVSAWVGRMVMDGMRVNAVLEDYGKLAINVLCESPEAICTSLGKSKSWLYKWVGRHLENDNTWNEARSRRPLSTSTHTPSEIIEIIKMVRLNLYNQDLFCGAQAILWEMEWRFTIHESFRGLKVVVSLDQPLSCFRGV
jgi:hypothetical protein